jgi:hypothetical protein
MLEARSHGSLLLVLLAGGAISLSFNDRAAAKNLGRPDQKSERREEMANLLAKTLGLRLRRAP